MRRNQHTRARLNVRRETLRRLSALGDRQLARVVGGSEGGDHFEDTSGDCWTVTATYTYSGGSRYC